MSPLDRIIGSNSIFKALGALSPRQATVIKRRFGLNGPAEKHKEIAESFGVDPERIRQIEAKALMAPRHPDIAKVITGED